MRTIKWKGEEREIPGFGLVSFGVEKTLPDLMAFSFVEQQEADLVEVKRTEPKKSVRNDKEVTKL